MNNDLSEVISNIPNLTEQEKQKILESIVIEEFPKGTLLLREGQVSQSCYFVIKGCVRQYVLKDGVEKTTAFFTEGDSITDFTSYTNHTESSHNLICIADLTTSTPEAEMEMYKTYPALESFAHREVSIKTGELQEELSNFITSTPEERYLKILENKPDLLTRVPQHHIASYIGVTPESLSRIRKRIAVKR